MTGPEHYLAAEKLLEETQEHPSSSINKTASLVGQAQVHATLALAAATALASVGFESREWISVAGSKLGGLNSTRVTTEDRVGYSATVRGCREGVEALAASSAALPFQSEMSDTRLIVPYMTESPSCDDVTITVDGGQRRPSKPG